MSRSPIAKSLPELIDQLLGAESSSARQELIENAGEICSREVIAGIADAVNRIAREELPRAERLANAACWLADLSGDLFCRARIRRAAGNLQVLRGEYADAIETFDTCIEQFTAVGEEVEVAATFSGSLQPLIYLGRYSDALERAQRARDIAARYQDDLLLARLDVNVGNILHRQDRFSEAIHHYERALAILDRLGQRRDCAIAWLNLAVGYIALNDFSKGEEAYLKTRALALSENMPSIAAQADYNVAYLYYRRGDYMKAIQLYQQTREYCECVADRLHSALCDLDQAEMYLELHLNPEGTQLAQQAVSAFEKMDMGYEAAKALVWLGIAAHQRRKPFEALDFFAKAREQMKTQENAVWVALLDFYRAIVLYQEGRFHEALRSSIAAHNFFFSSFPNAGKTIQVQLLRARLHLALSETRDADDLCNSAIQAADRLKSPALLTQGFALQGQIARVHGSVDLAIDSQSKALHWLERSPIHLQGEESKLSVSRNRLEQYEDLVSLTVSAPPNERTPEAILAFVEKAKSRDLAELLAFRANTVPAASRSHSGLVEQVRSLRTELSWYYGQIETAETRSAEDSAEQTLGMRSRIHELEGALMKTLGELRPMDEQFFLLQNAGTIPLEKIRDLIQHDEMILEFYEAHGLLYACLLGKNAIHIVRAARTETIRDLLRSLQSHFAKVNQAHTGSASHNASLLQGARSILSALYRELIQPIRSHLCGQRLVIVPHGLLHYLPFHALFDGSGYLTEHHIISYAGSASQYYLSSRKQVQPPGCDLIVVSRRLENRQGLHAAIKAALPNARVFQGETAGLEALKQHGPESRFIHLDTDLLLRRDNTLFSTLFIGKAEVSILDTYHLRLPCCLVGLTGTGPGLNSTGNGNEMHALAEGLEYAGAQTVLMPLWNIPGEPLHRFVENFYNRVSCVRDKALAFQQAIAAVREKFPHPYHWACFLLHGATGREQGKSSASTDGPL